MKRTSYLSFALITLAIFSTYLVNAQGGVALNATGAPPDSSALFDVSSTSKGQLMPRLTTAQRNAINKPANGLFIFNTDCNVINFNAGSPASPSWATVNSSNAIIAGVTITANPQGAICTGTSVTFTATPANGINSPTYQWKVNGGNVGTNSATYTTSSLSNGDVVICILSSSEACVTGSPVTSNTITMTVTPAPATPGVITGNTTACSGSTGNIYSISPIPGATSYNWTVPGDASIASGAGNTSITITFGSTSGNVSVAAVNSCGTSSSSYQAVTIISTPSTPGNISGPSTVCANASGQIYSVNAVSGATSYNWTVASGTFNTTSDTSISVTYGGSPQGTVVVTASNTCGTSSASSISISQSNFCPPLIYTSGTQIFTAPAGVTAVQYLVVGGGGGASEGGGGAGGFLTGTLPVVPGNTYTVTVGDGGSGGQYTSNGTNGGNSVFASITALGGGGGSAQNVNGLPGGSGGGGGAEGGGSSGGAGTAGQGNAGGNGLPNPNPSYAGGGGGGAGGAGGAATGSPYTNGAGGPGLASNLSGSVVYYAGGGGGGSCCGSCCNYGGPGGIGGGGDGSGSGSGNSGTPNTGGGGGGEYTNNGPGGNGGSGIVILSW